jgi:hypothetical protein
MSNQNHDAARPDAVTSDTASTVELTAYQSGPAVIRETRVLTLPEGRSRVFIGGLPKRFVPNSQTIVSVGGSGSFRVGQRSLRPANLTQQTMLAQSVGSKITLIEETKAGTERRITGTLEHIVDNRVAVLRIRGGKVLVVPITAKFELGNVPAGLSNLTILAMEPNVEKAGEFHLKLLYESEGINWTPWYEVFYNQKTGKLERFACYVDLGNDSGTDFNDAGIKLIAGHNQSDAANRARAKGLRAQAAPMMAMAAGAGSRGMALESADFSVDSAESESVGEQKMYRLADRVSLENGVPNSPALVFFGGIPVIHEYHANNAGQYFRLDGDNPADLPKLPVSVKLRLCNSAANGLGAPLPPGDVRIFEADSQGELQKTDSASVSGHIAVGEEFSLDLRNPARDIKVVRQQVSYKEDPKPVEEEATDEGNGDVGTIRPQVGVTGGPNVGRPDFGLRQEIAESADQTAEAGTGKKKRTRKLKPKPRYAEEVREITVLNFKDVTVEVVIHDYVPADATVLDKSHEFVKFGDNNGSGSFRVEVPAKNESAIAGEFKVRYAIRYRIG